MVKHFFELMRPMNSFMAAFAVFIGAYIIGGPQIIGLAGLELAVIATFFISGGGMAINDYFDRDIDTINKPHRPIPSGRISVNATMVFAFILFAIGIYISFFINLYCLTLAVVNSFFLLVYSWHLKKVTLVGHLIVSYLVASSFLFGGFAVISQSTGFLLLAILFTLSFFANLSREIIKTIEDIQGDRMARIRSLPMVLGEKKARLIASLLLLVSIIAAPLPYIFDYFSIYYLIAVMIGVVMFIFAIIWNQRETPAKRVHKLMKFAMLVCLLAFLVGAVF